MIFGHGEEHSVTPVMAQASMVTSQFQHGVGHPLANKKWIAVALILLVTTHIASTEDRSGDEVSNMSTVSEDEEGFLSEVGTPGPYTRSSIPSILTESNDPILGRRQKERCGLRRRVLRLPQDVQLEEETPHCSGSVVAYACAGKCRTARSIRATHYVPSVVRPSLYSYLGPQTRRCCRAVRQETINATTKCPNGKSLSIRVTSAVMCECVGD